MYDTCTLLMHVLATWKSRATLSIARMVLMFDLKKCYHTHVIIIAKQNGVLYL